tara:strand:- start:140 stop:376 length:237 start_codon:yes stop_codon:yes gene_type:complete
MLIRSFIFLTAGLLIIIFPKQMLGLQLKVEPFLVEKLKLRFFRYFTINSEEKGLKTLRMFSGGMFIIAIILFVYSILN